ncbi:MAG: PorT family protein [Bacteroidia bacterium]|nr:PorT family protein [Bacteroidia bacterium]
MKQIIIIILLFAITSMAFGQQSKINLGIEVAPSLIFLRGNEMLEKYNDPTLGYAGGIFLQYNVSEQFSLATNIVFEKKGCIATGTETNAIGDEIGKFTTRTNFNYLSAPLLLRYSFGKSTKCYINGGPFFSYLIKGSAVSKGTNTPRSVFDYTPLYKHLDLGIAAGVGVLIPASEKLSYVVELRNNLGLYDISDGPVYNDGKIITNSTNLLFGVIF